MLLLLLLCIPVENAKVRFCDLTEVGQLFGNDAWKICRSTKKTCAILYSHWEPLMALKKKKSKTELIWKSYVMVLNPFILFYLYINYYLNILNAVFKTKPKNRARANIGCLSMFPATDHIRLKIKILFVSALLVQLLPPDTLTVYYVSRYNYPRDKNNAVRQLSRK